MLNDYRQIVTALRNSTWMILPESLEMILEIVNMRLEGKAFSDEEIRLRLEAAENGDREVNGPQVAGNIGMLSLYGPIYPKANLMTMLSGATSLDTFSNDLMSLVNDDKVEHIVLDVDSPGGVSDMVEETGYQIREAREHKPIYAVANTVAGSAAYWLASQASKFYVTPSGKVGSLGVYTVHEDISRQDEAEGRKITFISAGSHKTFGNEHEPLSNEAKEYIQTIVDEQYDKFVREVAIGRNMSEDYVKQNFGDARVHSSESAAAIGMVDGVKSLDELVGSLLVETTPQVAGTLHSIAAKHQRVLETAANVGIVSKPGAIHEKEGRMNEQELRALLGLSADADVKAHLEGLKASDTAIRERLGVNADADVVAAVSELHEEITPIREAQVVAVQQKQFAEQFPEEYERLQKLETKDRKVDAQQFAMRYERFTKKDGEREVKSNLGFPAVTVGKIEQVHESISERNFNHTMLAELLNLITEQGFVDYGERGSSRIDSAVSDDPIKQFASRINSLMTEDKLSVRDATKAAVAKWPAEYEAYREAMSAKSKTTA